MTPSVRRVPPLAVGVASMAAGAWLGLVRLGWALPLPWPDQLILHGPLMIGGFLGTLIGLERAVGVGKPWAYAAPALTAFGSASLVLGPPGPAGRLCVTAGSAVVLAVFITVLRRQPSLDLGAMTVGAAAWLAGNAGWLAGAGIYRIVFWWAGFVVLTIAGERLKLNRLLRPGPFVRGSFTLAIGVLSGGIVLTRAQPDAGVRVVGAGLVLLTAWLTAFDVARRTVRVPGVTRYIAICLLSGYIWLGAAGLIAIATGAAEPGARYDAILHAIFLGFAVAMIFGHASIVFPAITGVPLRFHGVSYLPLALLHASVAARLAGDLVEELGRWRAWSGLLSAAALGAFLLITASSLRIQRQNKPAGVTAMQR